MSSRLCLYATWLVWPALAAAQGAAGAPAIEILPPAPEERGGPVLIRARVYHSGRPFTEQGQNRWCQATVRNRSNKVVAQTVLRDNGRAFDSQVADGIWTAPVRLELPAGSYFVRVLANREMERFSVRSEFVVAPLHAVEPTRVAERPPDLRIAERLDRLSAEIHSLRPTATCAAVLSLSALVLGLSALSMWLALRSRAAVRPIAAATEFPRHSASGWKPLLTAFEAAEAAIAGLKRELSGAYQAQRRFEEQRIKLLRDFLSVSQALESAKMLDADLTDALKANLSEALLDAGVVRWEPEVGAAAPPEAEQRAARSDAGNPLAVTRVLSPGFRLRDAKGWLVLVRPVVEVIPASAKENG